MQMSDDETAVLSLLEKHMSFEEIAQELGMTPQEVERIYKHRHAFVVVLPQAFVVAYTANA